MNRRQFLKIQQSGFPLSEHCATHKCGTQFTTPRLRLLNFDWDYGLGLAPGPKTFPGP